MGQNPKCLRRISLPPPSPVLANIHSILAYDVPDTENVGLPTKFRFNVGPALPIAGLIPVSCLRRRRKIITWSVVYFAQTRGFQPILFQC